MSSTSISASDASAHGVVLAPDWEDPLRAAPGSGEVCVVRNGGGSVVTRAFAASPLRLLTPRNDGHAAWIYTSSFGGGVVDGDHLAFVIDVGDGAAAFLSTQASTKVYRSPRGTSATVRARVGRAGLLVSAPDPVVCFAGARFEQQQEFDLAAGAALVAVDWMTSGRRESGERCSFAHYRSRVVVRVDGRLAILDAVALRREDGDLTARLGRFDVFAVAVVLGGTVIPAAASVVERLGRQPVQRRPDQLAVASPVTDRRLGAIGCVVRVAGRSVEAVGHTLRECLAFVPDLLGDDPWLRKW